MELDATFFLAEFSPGKGGKAKLYSRGIKQVQSALK